MADDQINNLQSLPEDENNHLNIPLPDDLDHLPSETPLGTESIVEEENSDGRVVRTYFPREGDDSNTVQISAPPRIEPQQPRQSHQPHLSGGESTLLGAEEATQPKLQTVERIERQEDDNSGRKKKSGGRSCLVLLILMTVVIGLVLASGYFIFQSDLIEIAFIDDLMASLTPQAGDSDEPDSMAATPQATPAPGVLIEPTSIDTDTRPSATPSIGVTRVAPTDDDSSAPTPTAESGEDEDNEANNDNHMIRVPGGTFTMGSGRNAHQVTLSLFMIDQTEVTNAQWAECFADEGCSLPVSTNDYFDDPYYGEPEYDDYPVMYVTWEQANEYCEWRGGRLPTEAEWEMAARFDPDEETVTLYPWGDEWDPTRLNFCDGSCALPAYANTGHDDGFPQSSPVGSFPSGASPLGLFDMAGNVAEWVADWYSPSYYASSPAEDPTGPASGTLKVVRGGAWGVGNADSLTSVLRSAFSPAEYLPGLGFRCAASP